MIFTRHALEQMAARDIGRPQVEAAVNSGEVMDESTDDRCVVLGLLDLRVVMDVDRRYVVTVYWHGEFRKAEVA